MMTDFDQQMREVGALYAKVRRDTNARFQVPKAPAVVRETAEISHSWGSDDRSRGLNGRGYGQLGVPSKLASAMICLSARVFDERLAA